MKFPFTMLDFLWPHMALWGGHWPDATQNTWDKIAPKLVVDDEENPTAYPMRLLDKSPYAETDGVLSAEVLAEWQGVTVEREFTVGELETMQLLMSGFVYHRSNRAYVVALKEKLKTYRDQANADELLKKLPQAAVDAARKQQLPRGKRKITPITESQGGES